MQILIVSFYYPPDLCAGSFRAGALVEQLRSRLKPGDSIRVITTQPNRYSSFRAVARAFEEADGVSIERLELPSHSSGFFDQSRAFLHFAREALKRCRGKRYDLVFATSSRLMTAALGAQLARRTKAPLYLDIRDLFTDTMGNLLIGPARALVPFVELVERWAFRRANRVNIVSPGFAEHVTRIRGSDSLSVHTNGVDPEFLTGDFDGPANEPPVILYAGNIGEGQGLDQIVPAAARLLGGRYRFKIIGDGGGREKLERALEEIGNAAGSVELCRPVDREELRRQYRVADILFLHLNAHEAFEKVIPSKIFEYGATGKPILAGIRGIAREFVGRQIVNARCFDPCDEQGLVRALGELELGWTDRSSFSAEFARDAIMTRMADEIVAFARSRAASI